MKVAIVTILLALVTSTYSASRPAVEIQALEMRLFGEQPNLPGWGTFVDIFVSTISNPDEEIYSHLGGMGCGYCITTGVQQSGVRIGVGGIASTRIPDMSGRVLPVKVVDIGRIPRTVSPTIRTNKNGYVYPSLLIGSHQTDGAEPLCDPSMGIAMKTMSDVVLLGREDVLPQKIGAAYYACPCDPARCDCICKATGESWLGPGGPTQGFVTLTAGLGIFKVADDEPLPESPEPTPERLQQNELPWPGDGWYRLMLDNKWDTSDPASMCVLVKDPNESMVELLAATEAWVYCESGDRTFPRVATIMRDTAVGMNRCPDGFMSDYLFFVADSNDAGRYVVQGNPCHAIVLRNGQTIEPQLPDANVPDVLGSWLETESRSDLNGDGIVDGADYAISANNYGLQ